MHLDHIRWSGWQEECGQVILNNKHRKAVLININRECDEARAMACELGKVMLGIDDGVRRCLCFVWPFTSIRFATRRFIMNSFMLSLWIDK